VHTSQVKFICHEPNAQVGYSEKTKLVINVNYT